jgi:hypothetical protein
MTFSKINFNFCFNYQTKMSTFLKEMESKGCIKLKDNKGVLSITSFSKDHEMYDLIAFDFQNIFKTIYSS